MELAPGGVDPCLAIVPLAPAAVRDPALVLSQPVPDLGTADHRRHRVRPLDLTSLPQEPVREGGVDWIAAMYVRYLVLMSQVAGG